MQHSTTRRRAVTPALCPARRGRRRRVAQRPLPSIITATWRTTGSSGWAAVDWVAVDSWVLIVDRRSCMVLISVFLSRNYNQAIYHASVAEQKVIGDVTGT